VIGIERCSNFVENLLTKCNYEVKTLGNPKRNPHQIEVLKMIR
jgi:hypothetical protein